MFLVYMHCASIQCWPHMWYYFHESVSFICFSFWHRIEYPIYQWDWIYNVVLCWTFFQMILVDPYCWASRKDNSWNTYLTPFNWIISLTDVKDKCITRDPLRNEWIPCHILCFKWALLIIFKYLYLIWSLFGGSHIFQ